MGPLKTKQNKTCFYLPERQNLRWLSISWAILVMYAACSRKATGLRALGSGLVLTSSLTVGKSLMDIGPSFPPV